MTPFRPMRKQGLKEDLRLSQKSELEPRASVSQSCADPPSPRPLNQSPRTRLRFSCHFRKTAQRITLFCPKLGESSLWPSRLSICFYWQLGGGAFIVSLCGQGLARLSLLGQEFFHYCSATRLQNIGSLNLFLNTINWALCSLISLCPETGPRHKHLFHQKFKGTLFFHQKFKVTED